MLQNKEALLDKTDNEFNVKSCAWLFKSRFFDNGRSQIVGDNHTVRSLGLKKRFSTLENQGSSTESVIIPFTTIQNICDCTYSSTGLTTYKKLLVKQINPDYIILLGIKPHKIGF